MAEPFVGEIRMTGFNFAPQGWALCNGQLLAINQNTALFALLGTFYGGNGETTFALPNLQSRVPIHQGAGPGLTPYSIGELGGDEGVTLNLAQIPAHSHALACNTGGDSATPAGNFPGNSTPPEKIYAAAASASMNGNSIGATGGGQPHSNIQPYLVVNFIIALQGIFPPRS